ncbi:hypothetical protein HGRIS_012320 [Hohenbuehelia grisea]|uniref:Uncharacterized protein n=1 Tax=Hohenbuehelia grisea TaxID=104357 RepID=A0ABR3IRZ2_9AGAR
MTAQAESSRTSPRPSADALTSYFDKSATIVRDYADSFEHEYARPALKVGSVYYSSHPLLSVFALVFFMLSIVPVVVFIISSMVAAAGLALISATLFLVLFSTATLVFVSILLCTLLGIALLSALITVSGISTHLFIRLFNLSREHGRAGLEQWTQETRAKFVSSQQPDIPERDADEVHDANSAENSSTEIIEPPEAIGEQKDQLEYEI